MTTLTTQEYLKKIKEKKNRTPKNKYNASKTTRDSFTFHSKAEANFYEYLKDRQAKGEILYFLRQVPLHLPGNTKLVVDFVIFYPGPAGIPENVNTVEYVDVKGVLTPLANTKIKQAEALYPIFIRLEK